jgi:hypothetical protein
MSNPPVFSNTGSTTSKCELKPVSRHPAECGDNLPTRNAGKTVVASDWRAEAEARGRARYKDAAAEPQTTEEPLAWLWGSGVQGAKTQ